MILCDIGNTTIDILKDGGRTKIKLDDFSFDELIGDIYYINVNSSLKKHLETLPHWINVGEWIDKEKYYPTMGIDRMVGCEAIEHGIVVDAGSAITVDVMKSGVYQGGFIALGLRAAQDAYAKLSNALDTSFNFEVDLAKMAKNTPDALSIGYLAPLVEKIQSLNGPIYLTGGDAKVFARFLPKARVDEDLIFTGMMKLIEKGAQC